MGHSRTGGSTDGREHFAHRLIGVHDTRVSWHDGTYERVIVRQLELENELEVLHATWTQNLKRDNVKPRSVWLMRYSTNIVFVAGPKRTVCVFVPSQLPQPYLDRFQN